MLAAYAPSDFSANSEENTFRSSPWIGGPCSPGGDTADYPGCAPRWLLRGGAGPGWGPAGVCSSGPRTAQLGRSVLAGEGHVQFEREDREAQWREAGRVRVRHLPGEGRAGPAPRRRVLPTPAPVPPPAHVPFPGTSPPAAVPPAACPPPRMSPFPGGVCPPPSGVLPTLCLPAACHRPRPPQRESRRASPRWRWGTHVREEPTSGGGPARGWIVDPPPAGPATEARLLLLSLGSP